MCKCHIILRRLLGLFQLWVIQYLVALVGRLCDSRTIWPVYQPTCQIFQFSNLHGLPRPHSLLSLSLDNNFRILQINLKLETSNSWIQLVNFQISHASKAVGGTIMLYNLGFTWRVIYVKYIVINMRRFYERNYIFL